VARAVFFSFKFLFYRQSQVNGESAGREGAPFDAAGKVMDETEKEKPLREIDPRITGGTILGGIVDEFRERVVLDVENNNQRFDYVINSRTKINEKVIEKEIKGEK
jgi:hypothetical protein